MTLAVFHDFPGLENGLTKFHDFPGRVVTLGSETTSSPRWPGVVCPSNVFDALLSIQTITAEYRDGKKLGYFTKNIKVKVHPRSYGLYRTVLTAIFRARQPIGCHYILPGPQLPSQLQSHCTWLVSTSFTNLSHHRLPSSLRTDLTDFTTGPFLLSISVLCLFQFLSSLFFFVWFRAAD